MNEQPSPFEEIWVALDLETTGLSASDDEIIEVGAVKFRSDQLLDTFQTFINPYSRLSDFIKGFTGITQAEVDRAPPFSAMASELVGFIGPAPVVGHNLAFDLAFLEKKGLRISNPTCDTWDLAYVLLPGLPAYSLSKLSRWLDVKHPRPHRAVEDALATRDVFVELLVKMREMDPYILAEMQRLSSRSNWVLSSVLTDMVSRQPGDWAHSTQAPGWMQSTVEATVSNDIGPVQPRPTGQSLEAGISGVDIEDLRRRLQRERSLRPNQETSELDLDYVASLLKSGGPLAAVISGFEERSEQVSMAKAVATAINGGQRLIVEAGTGVGKSLAYLLPALLYASMNNKRVVVSTNTINLQEQLVNKDVPTLLRALASADLLPEEGIRFTQLKGRANYLCYRRWSHLRSSESLNEDEARLLAKTLVWLRTTTTGDRSELNLGHRSAAAPWDRLSAQGAFQCLSLGGPCFLRAARERAAASHLVIVNHALLMSDLTSGGTLIPEADILIVDEAHHLEDEATRRLGFELGQSRFDEHLRSLTGDRGLLNEAVSSFRGASAAETRRRAVEEVAADAVALIPDLREKIAALFALLSQLVADRLEDGVDHGREVSVTGGIRAQPAWSELEMLWGDVDALLKVLGDTLRRLEFTLGELEHAGLLDYQGLLIEAANTFQRTSDLRERLAEFISRPGSNEVYWMTAARQSGEIVLHGAPLQVGETLNSLMFSQKRCVVMTSATLSANGSFEHTSDRTGFAHDAELLVGSPFDYPNAALLCVPEDMPEPGSGAYQKAAERAITEITLGIGGRTMALFTSHASLRATAANLRETLTAQGIAVLAQGIDGTPHQLIRRFLEDPCAVLLGTASFWEGVDLAGESLVALLVMRLPFSVPSEPVFAARSESYEDPFNEYAVPQAVLRLRQGFGRLIRTSTDRGAAVILDRRIISRRYGKAFLDSLPPVTFRRSRVDDLRDEVVRWVGA